MFASVDELKLWSEHSNDTKLTILSGRALSVILRTDHARESGRFDPLSRNQQKIREYNKRLVTTLLLRL